MGVARRGPTVAQGAAGRTARARADELVRKAPVRALLARALGVRTEERDYQVGADGEEMVARRLRALDARWHVIHAVPVGCRGADIDHVVVGPPGVFTLNTKHHPRGRVWVGRGSVVVNGRATAYVRATRVERSRVARLLGAACRFRVEVRPVLVVGGRPPRRPPAP